MANGRCRDCYFYDKNKQVCNNPNRDDSKSVFYYGHIDPNSYCILFMPAPVLEPVNVSSVPTEKDYYTPEEVRKMSQSEVRKNYQAIMDSMKKWS